MFCNQCGKEIPDDSKFCESCGSSLIPLTQEKTNNTKPANSKKEAGKLAKIKCNNCGCISEPKKWNYKFWFNILYIPMAINLVGLIYYMVSNPYICRQCNERNKLVKILNSGKEVEIRSFSKKAFIIVSALVLVVEAFYILAIFAAE